MAEASAWSRPVPKEAPAVKYTNEDPSNPVLRGYPFAVAATL
jgi:hypothetical protein